MRWWRGWQGQSGVLLLEALLVLVVLSMTLTLMVQAMSSSLRATQQNADYADAILLMDNKMFAILTEGKPLDMYTGQDNLDEPYDRYSFQLQHQVDVPLDSSQGSSEKLHAMNLDLKWTTGKKTNHLRMTTYLFDGLVQGDSGK
jgi:hypothetical protein